jgi:hypothetical protein
MTAYRSTNTYRQDLLRYDGGTNVIVAPATIAATSTVPAVTVSEGAGVTVAAVTIAATATVPVVSIYQSQTIYLDPIGAVATTPAVTVTEGTGVSFTVSTVDTTSTAPAVTITEGVGVTVSLTTVSSSGLIPDVTVTEGAGVTATGIIAALAAFPALTVTEGSGVSVTRPTIRCSVTVPDPGLEMRIIMTGDTPGALLDVQPYHVTSIERRWKSRWAAPAYRSKNIFILTDNTITNRHPIDPSTISRQILGGHESPTDLSSEEQTLLIDAGYAFEVV